MTARSASRWKALSGRAASALRLDGLVARNSALLLAANASGKGFALLLNALIVWALGDDRFGEFRAAIACAGIFANMVELGLLRPGVRAVARAPWRSRDIFFQLLKTKAVLAAGTALALVAWTEASFADGRFRALVYLWFGVVVAHGAKRACDCVFMGRERMGFTAAFLFANRLGTLLFSAAFLAMSHSLVGLFALFLLIEWIEAFVQFWAALRMIRQGPAPAPEGASEAEASGEGLPRGVAGWVREGLPFGMHELALEISFRLDSVMLYAAMGAASVAVYNKAYLILTSALMLPNVLCQALFPSLSAAHRRDPGEASDLFRRSLPMFVLAGPALAALFVALKEPILAALKGSSPETVQVYHVSMATLPVFFLTMPLGYFLGAIDRQGKLAVIAGIAAGANVAMNLRLIPAYGAMGAATATLATELIALGLIVRCVLPGGFGRAFDLRRLLGFGAFHAGALWLGWPWLAGSWAERIAFFALYFPAVGWLAIRERRRA